MDIKLLFTLFLIIIFSFFLADAVLGILKRVAASVDQITTTLDLGNESEAPSCEVPAPIVDEQSNIYYHPNKFI